jgi:hypothetical protein
MIGPTILQGPHQAAQKSTTTGLSLFKTTSSKVASVISSAISFVLLFRKVSQILRIILTVKVFVLIIVPSA